MGDLHKLIKMLMLIKTVNTTLFKLALIIIVDYSMMIIT